MSKSKMTDKQVDEIICEIVDVCSGIGIWNTVLNEMAEKGYTAKEVDEALDLFNKRNGRC